ncbi:hypothetical protein PC122_g23893 [Phytophthora cactorum]|nr:hypothetical protein PC122_g23893 [Phytophthora cactorum]
MCFLQTNGNLVLIVVLHSVLPIENNSSAPITLRSPQPVESPAKSAVAVSVPPLFNGSSPPPPRSGADKDKREGGPVAFHSRRVL